LELGSIVSSSRTTEKPPDGGSFCFYSIKLRIAGSGEKTANFL